MWLALLVLSLVAAGIHLNSMPARPKAASAELVLIYLLAGYCGFAQIIRSIAVLVRGQPLMGHVQFTPGDPAVMWLGFFGLGCGLIGAISIWRRGNFLLAPVIVWAVFWTGTTLAHIRLGDWNHVSETWPWMLWTFATHGLIAVLLVVFYSLSVRPSDSTSIGGGFLTSSRMRTLQSLLTLFMIFSVSGALLYVLFNRKTPFVNHHGVLYSPHTPALGDSGRHPITCYARRGGDSDPSLCGWPVTGGGSPSGPWVAGAAACQKAGCFLQAAAEPRLAPASARKLWRDRG